MPAMRSIRDFDEPGHYLMMATRKGLVKKTELKAYRRPLKSGMIAIKLKDGDELVDVVVAAAGQEVVLATAGGLAIRFKESDARPMGRNTSGVKGITLAGDDRSLIEGHYAATLPFILPVAGITFLCVLLAIRGAIDPYLSRW